MDEDLLCSQDRFGGTRVRAILSLAMIRMHSAISREDRACLLLALGRLSSSENEEVNSLLSTPLQWEKILQRILQHEDYPLVFRHLKACGFPGVPGQVRSRLHTLFQM